MGWDGRVVSTLLQARERVFSLLGYNVGKRQGPDQILIMDYILDGLNRAARQIGVPISAETNAVTLVAGTAGYLIPVTSDLGFTDIISVTLFDSGNSEEQLITPRDLQWFDRNAPITWREEIGVPLHWYRGGFGDEDWARNISVYPIPDAPAVTDWPEINITVGRVDVSAADGALSAMPGVQYQEILMCAVYHACAEYSISRRDDTSRQNIQIFEARYQSTIDNLQRRMASEHSNFQAIPYVDF